VSAPADNVFRSLADPTRRALFESLAREGEQTVHALTKLAGVSQPAVSKHLAVLKQAGLVIDRPKGREVHYRVDPQGLVPLIDWMRHYDAFWNERFDHLEALLETMDDE
jgi:DNA-binding transcriptional ArsR family regulator